MNLMLFLNQFPSVTFVEMFSKQDNILDSIIFWYENVAHLYENVLENILGNILGKGLEYVLENVLEKNLKVFWKIESGRQPFV